MTDDQSLPIRRYSVIVPDAPPVRRDFRLGEFQLAFPARQCLAGLTIVLLLAGGLGLGWGRGVPLGEQGVAVRSECIQHHLGVSLRVPLAATDAISPPRAFGFLLGKQVPQLVGSDIHQALDAIGHRANDAGTLESDRFSIICPRKERVGRHAHNDLAAAMPMPSSAAESRQSPLAESRRHHEAHWQFQLAATPCRHAAQHVRREIRCVLELHWSRPIPCARALGAMPRSVSRNHPLASGRDLNCQPAHRNPYAFALIGLVDREPTIAAGVAQSMTCASPMTSRDKLHHNVSYEREKDHTVNFTGGVFPSAARPMRNELRRNRGANSLLLTIPAMASVQFVQSDFRFVSPLLATRDFSCTAT